MPPKSAKSKKPKTPKEGIDYVGQITQLNE